MEEVFSNDLLKKELEIVNKDYETLEETHKNYHTAVSSFIKLQTKCVNEIAHQRKRLKQLKQGAERPDGLMYDLFRTQFLTYHCYTTFLQFLQFYYQQGCLYRLRTLGERYDMDVTIQGFHSWMWRGLSFLIPFLYMGYIFQFYNAYTLYNLSLRSECSEWQVPLSAFIFFLLFLGNTFTTSLVIQQKLTEKISEKILSERQHSAKEDGGDDNQKDK